MRQMNATTERSDTVIVYPRNEAYRLLFVVFCCGLMSAQVPHIFRVILLASGSTFVFDGMFHMHLGKSCDGLM